MFIKTTKKSTMLKEIKEVFSEVHHLLWHNRLAVKRAYDLSDDEQDD